MTHDRHTQLCELHAHTTWSDGSLSLPELVDLYGNAGFDVLCVTDHSVPGRTAIDNVHPGNYDAYLAAIESEAERARDAYDLLVIPGLELTLRPRPPGGQRTRRRRRAARARRRSTRASRRR